MLAQFASDFSPEVRFMYNASASIINKGHFVCRAISPTCACSVADPIGENSPTRNVMGIMACAPSITAHQEAVIGVAMEPISASSWGPVCVGGPCQVLMSASGVISTGMPIGALGAGVSAGVGVPLGLGATFIAVPAWTLGLQTVSGSPAAATNTYLDVFIEPVRVFGAGGVYT